MADTSAAVPRPEPDAPASGGRAGVSGNSLAGASGWSAPPLLVGAIAGPPAEELLQLRVVHGLGQMAVESGAAGLLDVVGQAVAGQGDQPDVAAPHVLPHLT